MGSWILSDGALSQPRAAAEPKGLSIHFGHLSLCQSMQIFINALQNRHHVASSLFYGGTFLHWEVKFFCKVLVFGWRWGESPTVWYTFWLIEKSITIRLNISNLNHYWPVKVQLNLTIHSVCVWTKNQGGQTICLDWFGMVMVDLCK